MRRTLECGAPLVRHDVQRAADQRRVGDGVVETGDATPRRGALSERGDRCGVQRELALVAVADEADRVRRAGGREHDRRGKRIQRHVGHDAGTENRAIAIRVRTDRSDVRAALEVFLALRRARRELLEAVVEQAVVVGPRGRPELRPVDRLAGLLAGGDLDHVQDALLGAARRDAVRDVPVVRRRREIVDREVRTARALDRLGIDEQALLAAEPRADVELGNIFLRQAF